MYSSDAGNTNIGWYIPRGSSLTPTASPTWPATLRFSSAEISSGNGDALTTSYIFNGENNPTTPSFAWELYRRLPSGKIS